MRTCPFLSHVCNPSFAVSTSTSIVGDRQVKFNFNGLAYRAWVTVRRFFSFLNPKGISYTAFTAWANAKDVQTLAGWQPTTANSKQQPVHAPLSFCSGRHV